MTPLPFSLSWREKILYKVYQTWAPFSIGVREEYKFREQWGNSWNSCGIFFTYGLCWLYCSLQNKEAKGRAMQAGSQSYCPLDQSWKQGSSLIFFFSSLSLSPSWPYFKNILGRTDVLMVGFIRLSERSNSCVALIRCTILKSPFYVYGHAYPTGSFFFFIPWSS